MENVCEGCAVHLPNTNKSLCKAAQGGHGKCLKTLIQAGADVNSTSTDGKTALVCASYHNRQSCCHCVKVLLDAGADVNKRDQKEMLTSLMLAARVSCKPCVELLLKKEADVNALDAEGNGALLFAINSAKDICVAPIIAAGADVNKSNKEGGSPITEAARFATGNMCLSLLLNAGADVNTTDRSNLSYPVINIVARIGDEKELGLLIKAGADVNSLDVDDNTPLVAAAAPWLINRQVEKAALLLRSGAKINLYNRNNYNALMAHINYRKYEGRDFGMEMNMLLFAAGETIEGTTFKSSSLRHMGDEQYEVLYIDVPEYLLNTELKLCLKHLCRESIRKHLLKLDPHTHLFDRVPSLGLPKSLTEYLLYYQTLNDDDDDDGDFFV